LFGAALIKMKIGKLTHAIAVLLSSVASLFAHGADSKTEPAKTKFSKKSEKSGNDRQFDISSIAFTPGQLTGDRPDAGQGLDQELWRHRRA
jgi:hypothetical protein